ncbi:MAG: tetratricopeptide repeat protein [Desulfobacterales bacterium]|nr:MAG: tetratricopeptide repeat protein [Desulfobacterales bacterium]
MNKKNTKNAPNVTKQTAMIAAIVTFALGFFAGVVFTVHKTDSVPNIASDPKPDINYAQKAKALEVAVMNNPDNTAAWIQLGHVYFDTDKYEKAINAYEKALELNPINADVLTDLGVMYRRSGQPRKAIENFDKAVAVDPKHETARLNKGIVLLHDLKDRDGAIQAWEELLEINPLAKAGNNLSVDQLIKHYKKEKAKNTFN